MKDGPATDGLDEWQQRLLAVRGTVVRLPRDTAVRLLGPGLSDRGEPDLVLAAGTSIRYEETRYDAMRLDRAEHVVRVVAGPAVGRWASIGDVVGPGPLPWEE